MGDADLNKALVTEAPRPSSHDASTWWSRRLRALRGVVAVLALLVAPLAFEAVLLRGAVRGGDFAVDFNDTLLPAARAVASGDSPYPAYGYPPLVAFALAPLTVVPSPDVVFTVLVALCAPAALWVLGVRDWRCFGAAFLWGAVFHGIQTANVTLPLLLGVAFAWRYREQARAAGISLGLGVAAKMICWPLGTWLVATRRWRATLASAAVALIATFGLWATLGFSGLGSYVSGVNGLQNREARRGYTIEGVAADLGFSAGVGQLLMLAVLIGLLILTVVFGRRGDDRRSYSSAVFACIVGSPIVWLHSFVFLLAPLALYRPRFSAWWLLPALMALGDGTGGGAAWRRALVLGVGTALFAGCLRKDGGPGYEAEGSLRHVVRPAPATADQAA